MKIIRQFLTSLLLLPTPVLAHPRYVNEGFFPSSQYALNGTGSQFIFLGPVLFALSVVWRVEVVPDWNNDTHNV